MGKLMSLARGGKEPPRNADRLELAEAIAEISRLTDVHAGKHAVASRAAELVDQASAEHESAVAAVESAREALRSRMTEAAHTGAAVGRDSELSAAHARLATADEALAAAQTSFSVLKSSASDNKDAVETANQHRDRVIGKILGNAVDPILKQAEELRDKFMAKLLELSFVHQHTNDYSSWPPTERSRLIGSFFQYPLAGSPYAGLDINKPQAALALVEWYAAFDALKHDPDASLPGPEEK